MMDENMNWVTCLPPESKSLDFKSLGTTPPRLVELLIELYTTGWTQQQVLSQYPNLNPEIVHKVFRLAGLLCFREEVVSQLSLSTEGV